jgi:hypothetical protein
MLERFDFTSGPHLAHKGSSFRGRADIRQRLFQGDHRQTGLIEAQRFNAPLH